METENLKCELCNKPISKIKSLSIHINKMHKDITLKEYYDKYLKKDAQEGLCKNCNKPTRFRSLTEGYANFCCNACSAKYTLGGPENTERRRQNLLKKFGVETTFDLPGVRDKAVSSLREAVKTRGKEIRAKIDATNIKKYGYRTSLLNEKVKAKTVKTVQEKYHVDHVSKNKDIMKKIQDARSKTINSDKYIKDWRNKFEDSFKDKLLDVNCTLLDIIGNDDIKFRCNKCNSKFTYCRRFVFSNRADIGLTPCTNCLNKHYHFSVEEKSLLDFVKGTLPDNTTILENSKDVLDNKRSEVDIYLPEYNLAIEYNGLYFHSSEFIANNAHLEKLEECNSKGIRLVTIFSDEWLIKTEIVKSRLRSILNKDLTTIYARKCILKKITSVQAKDFCSINHLQGGIQSSFAYGLFYEDELVSIMNFGKSRFNPNEYELLRFCNKLNFRIIGGASRLLKAFIRDTERPRTVDRIISYADRRWSDGELYNKLGMSLVSKSKPGYFYLNPINNYKKRENRINYQKSKLVAEGFDPNLTEYETMHNRGFKVIYDCGQLKFALKLE